MRDEGSGGGTAGGRGEPAPASLDDPAAALLERRLPPALLAVLGTPLRLQIMHRLSQQDRDVSTLARELDLGLDNISYHLRVLESLGLVAHVRVKTRHVYRLTDAVRLGVNARELSLTLELDARIELRVRVGEEPRREQAAPERSRQF